jgi:nitrogen fixation NifU-like protein
MAMSVPQPQFDELTREVILDHYRRPRNRGELAGATHHAHGMNPVCGDEIAVDLVLDGNRIADIAFRGQGCSISQSSASMMTECVCGHGVDEAAHMHDVFRGMMQTGAIPDEEIGDLEALQGVAKFPARVKCALLCWTVMENALKEVREGA